MSKNKLVEVAVWAVVVVVVGCLTCWAPVKIYTRGLNEAAEMVDSAWDHHAEFGQYGDEEQFLDFPSPQRATILHPIERFSLGVTMLGSAVFASAVALVAQLSCWVARFVVTFWPLMAAVLGIVATLKVRKICVTDPPVETPPGTEQLERPEGVAFDILRGFVELVSVLWQFVRVVLLIASFVIIVFSLSYASRGNTAWGIEQSLLTLRSAWNHQADEKEREESFRHAWFFVKTRPAQSRDEEWGGLISIIGCSTLRSVVLRSVATSSTSLRRVLYGYRGRSSFQSPRYSGSSSAG